ncbi:MAG: hypothetical protein ACRCZP_11455 [Phycicoccus sp.]
MTATAPATTPTTSAGCGTIGCDHPAPDTTICRTCTTRTRQRLLDIPNLCAELDTTTAKQNVTGTDLRRRSNDIPLPLNIRAAAARHDLDQLIRHWATTINRTGIPAPTDTTTPALATWLANHTTTLATHQDAATLVDDLTTKTGAAVRVIDIADVRWYAGPCPTQNCNTDLYGRGTAPTIVCPTCWTTLDATDRKTWLRDTTRDRLAGATFIASALTGLGTAVPATTIRKWASRGRLLARGNDPDGIPLYRVGDVLEILTTRTSRSTRSVA